MKIPKQVIIEVTSACQLKCKGCPHNKANVAGFMDFEIFKSIIDRIDFKTTVIPWMNGEPLLHPRYADMVRYITDKGLPCYITTNGMIWNEDLFQHITEKTSCYQIIFSLDGHSDKTIELARPGSNVFAIKKNIRKFGLLKEAKGSKIDMAVKICQRGQDWEEIELYIAYWLKHSFIDYVCYGRMLNEESEGMRRFPCQYFDNNFLILRHDCSSRLCAYNDRIVNGGENPVGVLGKNESLLEFYNNEKFTFFRQEQEKGHFAGPCKTCGYAYTGKGFRGKVNFRDKDLDLGEIYYSHDYYNEFFSLKYKAKPNEYY